MSLWCRLFGHSVKRDDNPVKHCKRCDAEYFPAHDMWVSGSTVREYERKVGECHE